jgi:hypothetical protein
MEAGLCSNESFAIDAGFAESLLAADSFTPAQPQSIQESGISPSFVEGLICKHLSILGMASGRALSEHLCLPLSVLNKPFDSLRTRKLVEHIGSAPFNDYYYGLTESGHGRVETLTRECGYIGPAPVPLSEYVLSVRAQSLSHESPSRERLIEACSDISVNPMLYDSLGPAVNSGGGMFLYGAPGNGKSTLARHIISCFGQSIWVPYSIVEDGNVIKYYDPQFHKAVPAVSEGTLRTEETDRRWVRIHRPTVMVGGELTLDSLELRHNPVSKISEAPLQLKSNCGCLLIDDFGRQRISPVDLLNRWIVPLESHVDFLSLASGKKIQVPFEQLVIFSTNLRPDDLVDEAFLRRIPYKVKAVDPADDEFYYLFKLHCRTFECEYRKDVITYLLDTHYRPVGRAKRRCHARDLLLQVRNYCRYRGLPMELRPEYLDIAVNNYFTNVLKSSPETEGA